MRNSLFKPPEGELRWTMRAIADELIRLKAVEYIADSTVYYVPTGSDPLPQDSVIPRF